MKKLLFLPILLSFANHNQAMQSKQIKELLVALVQLDSAEGSEFLKNYDNETLKAMQDQIQEDMYIDQGNDSITSVAQPRSFHALTTGLFLNDLIAKELENREQA